MISSTDSLNIGHTSLLRRAGGYLALTKPRITLMVLIVAAAAFYLASPGGINLLILIHTLIGLALTNGGALTLNQVAEEDIDRIMKRTRTRPLPTNRVNHQDAFLFGLILLTSGLAYILILVNPLTALITAFAGVLYLLVYTPMKRLSAWNSVVGAIPGALPPVIGWAAASENVPTEAWVLFSILFIWQIPHALAIAILYEEDFRAAGIRLLPLEEPDRRKTGLHVVNFCAALLPVAMIPTLIGLAGPVYYAVSLFLGLIYLAYGIRLAMERTVPAARRLFFISLVYLPLVLLVMVLDQIRL